jgi:prepilin-type N-terminal cleavage/methylation domain-containing protein
MTTKDRTMMTNRRTISGFTIVEMIVTVGVLGILVAIVSTILSQCVTVVKVSEGVIRANATASGIAQVIRDDVRRTAKGGFISVSANQLVLGQPGTTQSVLNSASGDGAVVVYGLAPNVRDASTSILWRPGFVYTKLTAAQAADANFTSIPTDVINNDFASATAGAPAAPVNLSVPPQNLADIQNLWQVLAVGCKSLAVTATTDGSAWTWTGTATQNTPVWPRAVKITFVLQDTTLPAQYQNMQYEVVCPVGM